MIKKIIKEIKLILPAVILIFTFRSMAYEPYHIPTGSMKPSLAVGDFIIVEKFSYGLKLPFSEHLQKPIYLSTPSLPLKGEVIVFKSQTEKGIKLIKRVVATAGDRVNIVNGRIYINGFLKRRRFLQRFLNGRQLYATKSGEREHQIQFLNKHHRFNMDEILVPVGHVFVMGDNRDNSSDSRSWGFVPGYDIQGKAKFVWFNMKLPGDDTSILIRPARIGTLI